MKIDKLPKWAQAYIKTLEKERGTAIRALNEYIDNQTPSPIYIEEYECTGEKTGPSPKRRYIQSSKITIEHHGVELNIHLRENHINLQWGTPKRSLGDVAFIPSSYQNAQLCSKENMRD